MYCKQIYSDNIRKVFEMGASFSEKEINFFREQLFKRINGLKNITIENKQIEVLKETESNWHPIIGSHILEIAMNSKGLNSAV